jgi:calcineurin-like phosphoesterase family protein
MSIFFTADTHFGHAGIIALGKRPFPDRDARAMDEGLIQIWNARVRPDDDVWHLGDFAFGARGARLRGIFERLNGAKRLVRGNHDSSEVLELPWTEPPRDLVETAFQGHRLVLCHYPLRAWRGSMGSSIHLYGHVHGLMTPTRQSLDVGVDAWDMQPASLGEVLGRLERAEVEPEEQRLVRERKGEGGPAEG